LSPNTANSKVIIYFGIDPTNSSLSVKEIVKRSKRLWGPTKAKFKNIRNSDLALEHRSLILVDLGLSYGLKISKDVFTVNLCEVKMYKFPSLIDGDTYPK